ncbi:MAG: OprO/OprP family phosphate-selective porin [Rhodanobacter sp.]|jgi:hypothetical protein|nr:OprO/OprP family phosphate-selective porin [Rhodanobacter sp.]
MSKSADLAHRLPCWIGACCIALASLHAVADDDAAQGGGYHLGNGLPLGDSGLRIGGYATGSYERESATPPRVAVDNLSLFVWWEGEGRWKFFSELEYQNLLLTRERRHDHDGYLSLERAYIDYALTDNFDLRAGKFLTPIGRWNLIHATPLVWTTSRPLVTSLEFPTNMTGAMLTGRLPNLGNGVEYNVYGTSGSDLHTNPSVDPFTAGMGTHIAWTAMPNLQLGFSYANFRQASARSERKQIAGVDFLWTHNRYELSGEMIYRHTNLSKTDNEKGAYLQFVAPLGGKLYAVARYEIYSVDRDDVPEKIRATNPNAYPNGASMSFRVAGLNYRITPALVLKAEWVASSHNVMHAPDGLLASINVLF